MKHAIHLQKLREKKSNKLRKRQLEEEKILKERQRKAMLNGLKKLTILLGKLGVGKELFVHDHDATVRAMGFKMQMPTQRPPWKQGIEYGLSLSECVNWIKHYEQLQVIRKAEAQGLCKLIPHSESDPTDGV